LLLEVTFIMLVFAELCRMPEKLGHKQDIRRLERNDMTMIRWICSTKLSDKIPSNELKERLYLIGVEDAL